ncbi:MAG: hypothetical protein ABI670_06135 [Chloroflexota bacterium]
MDLIKQTEHEQSLPLKGNLTLAYLVSSVIAFIMTVASVAGLFDGPSVYPGLEAKMLPLFVGQDALNLIVGLPMLLGSMWLARRGSLFGLLLWPGALFYILYDYGYYVLGAPFNAFFLPYIALMTLSAYTMIGIVASIDGNAVRERLAGTVPARLTGGVLATLALLFMALWTSLTISALASGTPLDLIAHVVIIMDLTVQLPALLVGGILLWRREGIAYVVAVGLLLQAGVYLAGLSVITIVQEITVGLPFDAVAVVPGFIVGAICFALIRPFSRGAAGHEHASSPGTKMAESAPVTL